MYTLRSTGQHSLCAREQVYYHNRKTATFYLQLIYGVTFRLSLSFSNTLNFCSQVQLVRCVNQAYHSVLHQKRRLKLAMSSVYAWFLSSDSITQMSPLVHIARTSGTQTTQRRTSHSHINYLDSRWCQVIWVYSTCRWISSYRYTSDLV